MLLRVCLVIFRYSVYHQPITGLYKTVCNADTLFILTVLHRSIRRYKAIKMITLPSRARALMSSPPDHHGQSWLTSGKIATA